MNGDDRIYKKLLEHDKRFDKNDKRWEENNKRWEQNDKCTNRMIKKLLEHDEKFEKMATSEEVQTIKNEVMNSLDKMTTILKRMDEERVFTAKRIERVENETERLAKENTQHAKDIRQIKLQLKIA